MTSMYSPYSVASMCSETPDIFSLLSMSPTSNDEKVTDDGWCSSVETEQYSKALSHGRIDDADAFALCKKHALQSPGRKMKMVKNTPRNHFLISSKGYSSGSHEWEIKIVSMSRDHRQEFGIVSHFD